MISVEEIDSILQNFGADISLQNETTSYNTSTGKIETSLSTSDNIKGVIDNYTSQEIGGLVESGDFKILIANTGVVVNTNTKVVFNSIKYSVINYNGIFYGNNILAYELQVRK